MAFDWKLRDAYAFMTERARTRAPQIIDYAAAPGAAFLVAPNGEIVLEGGTTVDIDVVRVARKASAFVASRDSAVFVERRTCVHAVSVHDGWTLCVLSTGGLASELVRDRTKRAAHVLALALVDGVRGGGSDRGSGGAPADARVDLPSRRKK